MTRALITGVNGFVGRHLHAELLREGFDLVGTDVQGVSFMDKYLPCDFTVASEVLDLFHRVLPDLVFHLAGQSNIKKAWERPEQTFRINVLGAVNLMEAVRNQRSSCRVLLIGSSDQYGPVKPSDCPVRESHPLSPCNPYAISKMSQEQIARMYFDTYGLDTVMTRSFNHLGPGQDKGFVASDFASAIVETERGLRAFITAGNLSALRDFSDVRDVVRAYRLLAEKGHSGEVYNIGSGVAVAVGELLERMRAMASVFVEVREDAEKLRPSDTPVISADIAKIRRDTGWKPEIPLEDTLADVMAYWRQKDLLRA